jgi:FHA domain
MLRQGASRRRIARRLNAAYADGLLSQETFTSRIEDLLGRLVIDPAALTGDLASPRRGGRLAWAAGLRSAVGAWWSARRGTPELLLALDWTGAQPELLIGRHYGCDVVLDNPRVSRRHARMVFRDGTWIVQDLASTNGTTVNGTSVGRCALRPGDRLALGGERLRID